MLGDLTQMHLLILGEFLSTDIDKIMRLNLTDLISDLPERLEAMELGELLGLWMQSFFVGICMNILTICIFLISFGRMLEIYLVSSVAPIPMAAMMSREGHHMGENYLRSLAALG